MTVAAAAVAWLCVAMALGAMNQRAAGCGMLQHNAIVHRSIQVLGQHGTWGWQTPAWAQSILSRYPEHHQAGAPAPDFGYVCFKDRDAGEDMHWTPFQVAAVQHIHRKYGQSPSDWGQDAEQLVAFLFGVASHMIADINWHGLGEDPPGWRVPCGRGYLKEQGGVNFDCDGALCQASHSVGDTGSEFILAQQVDTSWLQQSWSVPLTDLLEILQAMNHTVQAVEVVECASLFLLASHLISWVSPQLAASYTSVAPLLPEALQNHYLGGVDDNTVWTVRKWTQVAGWLDGSRPLGSVTVGDYRNGRRPSDADIAPKALVGFWQATADKGALVEAVHHNGSVRISLTEHWKTHLEALLPSLMGSQLNAIDDSLPAAIKKSIGPSKEARHQSPAVLSVEHNAMPTSWVLKPAGLSVEYAHFGASVEAKCDFNSDGVPDLVVGAPGATVTGSKTGPQTGQTYVFLSQASTNDGGAWADSPSLVLSGNQGGSRFGSALACGDFDADGFEDLAVGAPSAGHWEIGGWDRSTYRGEVFVFMGSAEGLTTTPALTVKGSPENGLVGLGSTLAAGVLTHGAASAASLVVGAPKANCWPPACSLLTGGRGLQVGAVGILFGGSNISNRFSSQGREVEGKNLDVLLYGNTDYSWFGSSLSVLPASVLGTGSCAGAVLAVGSPGWNMSTGRVELFDITQAAQPVQHWQVRHPSPQHRQPRDKRLLAALQGSSTLQEFGRSVAFIAAKAGPQCSQGGQCVLQVAVGAPWEQQVASEIRNGGAVHVFNISTGAENSPCSDGRADAAWVSSEVRVHSGQVHGGGLGLSLAALLNSDTLVAGQPFASCNSRAMAMSFGHSLELVPGLGLIAAALAVVALSLGQAAPLGRARVSAKLSQVHSPAWLPVAVGTAAAGSAVLCAVAVGWVIEQTQQLLADQLRVQTPDSAGSAFLFSESTAEMPLAWKGSSVAGRYAEAVDCTVLPAGKSLVVIGEPLAGFSSMDVGCQSGAVYVHVLPEGEAPSWLS